MRVPILLILFFPISIFSQLNSNLISKSEFNDMTINNARFHEIINVKGNLQALNTLLNTTNIKSDSIVEEKYYYYTYDGFNICYSQDKVVNFEITNSNWIVSINGKTVKVGSDSSELGDVKINNKIDGRKSIVFQYCDGCNNYLSFELDGNGKIMKIVYIEMT